MNQSFQSDKHPPRLLPRPYTDKWSATRQECTWTRNSFPWSDGSYSANWDLLCDKRHCFRPEGYEGGVESSLNTAMGTPELSWVFTGTTETLEEGSSPRLGTAAFARRLWIRETGLCTGVSQYHQANLQKQGSEICENERLWMPKKKKKAHYHSEFQLYFP